MSTKITFVALDSHKKQHSVAVIYPHTGELAQWTVRNNQKDIAKMVKKIKQEAPGEVRFCYEAGVCGFVLKRWIEAQGCSCSVIAPSLIPVKPGERIKTDRRDTRKLLTLFMNGQGVPTKRVRGVCPQRPARSGTGSDPLPPSGPGRCSAESASAPEVLDPPRLSLYRRELLDWQTSVVTTLPCLDGAG